MCRVSDGYSCSGSCSERQVDLGRCRLRILIPHHSLSWTVALWPPLLTNRISYQDCTDEVQGERDCCELAIFVVSWVVSAWAGRGDRKQRAGSRSQEVATVVSRAEWVLGLSLRTEEFLYWGWLTPPGHYWGIWGRRDRALSH